MSRYILVLDRNRDFFDIEKEWPSSASGPTLEALEAQGCFREPPEVLVRDQWTAVYCKKLTWIDCDQPHLAPEQGNVYKVTPR